MILLIVILFNWIITIFGLFLIHQILVYLRNKAPGQKTLLDDVYVQFLEYYAFCIMPVLVIATLRYFFGPLAWIVSFILGYKKIEFTQIETEFLKILSLKNKY